MTMMRNKSMVLLLIALLGSAAIANAASGIPVCPAKKCCRTSPPMAMMVHGGAMDMMVHSSPMKMEMPQDCTPKNALPCCDLESDKQPIELAVATATGFHAFRAFAVHLIADIHVGAPLVQIHFKADGDDGWPKIPKVPIFLQTLSILC